MPERDFAAAAATYFGPEYFNSVQGILTEERTAAEVSFVLSQTALRPPASVVDFGCGHGRHAREFARRGFDVLGLDANESYLAVARQNSTLGQTLRFINGDYRHPPEGSFDMAVSLFGSFGFGSDDDNVATLDEWVRRLRPHGWLVLELWHRDRIVCSYEAVRVWQPNAELEVEEQRNLDPLDGRVHVHYTYRYADGRRMEHDLYVRLYTAAELRYLLEQRGMEVRALFGSLRGDPYNTSARSLVLFAQRRDSNGSSGTSAARYSDS